MQPIFNAAPGAADAAAVVKDVTAATFMDDVVDASHDVPVIVDFWATWCGPCKTLGPQLEKAVRETKGAVRMVKVDVDRPENQQLAAQMRIQSIPAVYAFKDGRPVDGFVGAVPESQIKAFVKKLAGGAAASPVAEALEQAKAAFAAGDHNTAGTFFSHILQREPENVDALAGLGRVLLATGDAERARQLLDRIPAESANHAEVAALRSSLELAEAAEKAGATGDLEAKLAQNPNDHETRLDLANALFAQGDREGAVDQLLELIKRDRAWNEEAARKQLLKLFEAFGPTDPLTVASRRRLSALLFS